MLLLILILILVLLLVLGNTNSSSGANHYYQANRDHDFVNHDAHNSGQSAMLVRKWQQNPVLPAFPIAKYRYLVQNHQWALVAAVLQLCRGLIKRFPDFSHSSAHFGPKWIKPSSEQGRSIEAILFSLQLSQRLFVTLELWWRWSPNLGDMSSLKDLLPCISQTTRAGCSFVVACTGATWRQAWPEADPPGFREQKIRLLLTTKTIIPRSSSCALFT